MESNSLVTVKHLKKHFPIKSGFLSRGRAYVKAVDGVDLMIMRGKTVGLVGESGCGKSTLADLILRLVEPTSGEIYFEGENILELKKSAMRKLRREMQIIFQDPYSSLDPRKRLGYTLMEPFVVQEGVHHSQRDIRGRVFELMSEVGLRPEYVDRYPHEFSGGQRQRIVIARALALKPKFIICDEPVSALDVSIQAQVINLLQTLQEKHRLTYLFISHDLSVVSHISDTIAVMYLGRIVEIGPKIKIVESHKHPYTRALISASPLPTTKIKKERILLKGDVPSPIDPPDGCHFHPRCLLRDEMCERETPSLTEIEPNHLVRCFKFQ